MRLRSGRVAIAPLVSFLLATAPVSALASRTATLARNREFTYRDRTPRVHNGLVKHHHLGKKH